MDRCTKQSIIRVIQGTVQPMRKRLMYEVYTVVQFAEVEAIANVEGFLDGMWMAGAINYSERIEWKRAGDKYIQRVKEGKEHNARFDY